MPKPKKNKKIATLITTLQEKVEADLKGEELRADQNPSFRNLDPEQKYQFLGRDPARQMLNRLKFQETISSWQERLDAIESTAKRGRINGFRLLAFLAVECTKRLENWSAQYPEFVADVAAEYNCWPVLATPSRTQLDTKDWIRAIRLGTREPSIGTPPNLPLKASPARRWATGLKRIIDMARGSIEGQVVAEYQAYPSIDTGSYSYPGFQAEAKALPAFSKSTRREWWVVAKRLFASLTNKTP